MTLPANAAQPRSASRPTPWKPVLLRAAVGLVFGLVTAFWSNPSGEGLAWAMGLYLLATAGAVWMFRTLPVFVPVVIALGGIGALVTRSDAGVALSAVVALLVLGASELTRGVRKRDDVARDWLISGVVSVGTAVALPFFISMGAHALLGVAGGGAIICGVLWILSGLTLRHEAKTSSGPSAPGSSAEAVN
ncbi:MULTISPECIES: hypothetical protein [Paenarthrobacter]|uniref:Uncharacterized protein n=1 Tax=Paenarthrobacter ureafaciens TaxID=37931 RepID=A0AAX3EJ12_PAEUR|nr:MULTISPECIES: hypothetical protein [Paenarthrobacter]MDO5866811.1 hypothetical protein [Paenarthrobacter sp. SD-2]MDO5877912.1 hypothetical protein [Paenarthrobacter sp. SD-1]UYV93082.1 hypothetical protein NL395_21730 [Paenarthrobacter ureafaciens]UYV97618.1 hypothetical protein NL394_21755 [Paenarthrobacter ureafaciens]WIV32995.1 hypothetical protein QN084_10450 [Paenarthrobacter sp. R1]